MNSRECDPVEAVREISRGGAYLYAAIWNMVESGALDPAKLIGRRITLEESTPALINMDSFGELGITIIIPRE